jgi:NAD(P)-dependent dehydrogenase (short-subunit alcohol dehydrogenase family)
MNLQLDGKIALVTGSTAGIGHAIAAALASEGATVIVNGRHDDAVQRAVQGIQAGRGGQVLGFAGDLTQAATAEALAAQHPQVHAALRVDGGTIKSAF